ncbi:UNVERIFIED_CONTAM: hypothetical protein Scaly_0197500 [Sesamum calycinum]|uniref:Neprosin PEP catalytic domain-containing protein n=1 Tax=Sesamum calycinum TaxID=2727403 RepID=A0AAW2SXQ4_9LAMI
MDMKVRVGFWLFFLFMAPVFGAAARSGVARRNLEVRRHLSRVNKPSVKSIKSPDGDIIDCVHISHQPAFDHPFLKNHTVQAYLSSRRAAQPEQESGQERDRAKANNSAVAYEWEMPRANSSHKKNQRRGYAERAPSRHMGRKSIKAYRGQSVAPEPDLITQNGHQHAIAYVEGDQYYGAKATINVWDPKIQQSNEFSLSQLWILGGSFASDLNSIEAGWQSDAYQATGCYNLLCSGFIQINNEIAMGASIYPFLAIAVPNMTSAYLSGRTRKRGTGGCNLEMAMY